MLLIDVDHFKDVNDLHGHIVGDEVLKEIGQLLIEDCRIDDFVSRIGGDEFAIILDNPFETVTLEIAERIRESVESNTFILSNGAALKITVSIGIALYPDTVSDVLSLREKADIKLYEAKRQGRNRVCI